MKPRVLKPGDTIGVMAPSSHVERADIERAAAVMEGRGYKVFVHPQTFERDRQSAGTPLQKTLAFQGLWQREDIRAVWAAGGGNRALHFLDSVNFEALKKKPKILVGFSDVTVLLNAVYAHAGIPTFHGPVFKHLDAYHEWDGLLALLGGEIPPPLLMPQAKALKGGIAEGPLIGGNLSLFQYLPQTLPGKFWQGGILFLEDCGEELSKLDRMLLHLRRLGVLGDIAGLLLGTFSDMKESGRPYGFTLEEIVTEHTEGLDIPVVINAPFGHDGNLPVFPVGGMARLESRPARLTILESPVAA